MKNKKIQLQKRLWIVLCMIFSCAHASVPEGFLDVTAAPYSADKTGVTDSTLGLQTAINDARDNNLVLWLPGGTYLVSDRLVVDQPDNDAAFPVVIMGSTVNPANRATIVLAANSTGFNDPAARRAVLHYFNSGTVDAETGNTDLYNQAIIGVDFKIRSGNGGAVALRMQAAEGSTIQDVNIDLTEGGHTGIWGVPGSGGATHKVTVTGGVIGIDTRLVSNLGGGGCQPTAVITGSSFINQSAQAIFATSRGATVLIGCKIHRHTSGPAIRLRENWVGQPFDSSFHFVDSTVEYATYHAANSVLDMQAANLARSFHFENSYVLNGHHVFTASAPANPSGWRHYQRLAVHVLPDARTSPLVWQPRETIYLNGRPVGDVLSQFTDEAPPADLQSRHRWRDDFPTWEHPGVVNVKHLGARGDGVTDDWAVLQAAIDNHEVLFFPKGTYRVSDTLDLRPDSKLIGGYHQFTSIRAIASLANRFAGTNEADGDRPIIRSADTPNADTILAFFSIQRLWPLAQHNPTAVGNYALEWRSGGTSLLRHVEVQAKPNTNVRPDFIAQNFYGYNLSTHPINANHPQLSFQPGQWAWPCSEPNVQIRGNGGGRWFTFWVHGRQGLRSHVPFLRVENTSQPLNFYHLHVQQQDSVNHAEFINASNVSIFGTKAELKGTLAYFEGCNNVRLIGHGGLSSPDPAVNPPFLFRFINTDNFLIAGIGDTVNEGSSSWVGGAFDRWIHAHIRNWRPVLDQHSGRAEVQVPWDTRPIVYVRGNPNPAAVTGQFSNSVAILNPSNGAVVAFGDPVEFSAYASSAAMGNISNIGTWTSSINGNLGSGASITTSSLSAGAHTITYSVDLPGGGTLTEQISMLVELPPPPSIAEHPQSVMISSSELTQLAVTASGSGLSYQWYSGVSGNTSSPIPGATAPTLTTPALNATTTYWVRVSNLAGSVDSLAATVTINNPPAMTLTSPSSGQVFIIGSMVSLVASATDTEDGQLSASIVWTSSIDGELGQGGSVDVASLSAGSHRITATVTDSGGRSTASFVDLKMWPRGIFTQEFELGPVIDNTTYVGSAENLFDFIGIDTSTNNRAAISIVDGALRNTIDYTDDETTTQISIARLTRRTNLPVEEDCAVVYANVRMAPDAWASSGDPTFFSITIGENFRTGVFSPSAGTGNGPAFTTLNLQARGGTPHVFRATRTGTTTVSSSNFTIDATDGVYSANIILAVNSGAQVRTFPSPTGNHTLQADALSLWVNNALIFDNVTTGLNPAALIRQVSFATGSGAGADYLTGSILNGYYEIDEVHVATLSGFIPLNTPPSVSITAPADNTTITQGTSVNFTGTATDEQEGNIVAQATWTSSIDGLLGNGGSLSTSALSPGTHTFTFAVTDSGGLSHSAQRTLTVAIPSYAVNFTAGPGGGLTGTTSQSILSGGSTTAVTAVPADGYFFVNWTWTGGNTSTANPLTISNVTQALSVTANFQASAPSVALFEQNFNSSSVVASYTGTAANLFDFIGTDTSANNRATFSIIDGRIRNTVAYTDDGNTTQLSAARLTRRTDLPIEQDFAVVYVNVRMAPNVWPGSGDHSLFSIAIGENFRTGVFSPTGGTGNGPAFTTISLQARGGSPNTFRTTRAPHSGSVITGANFTITPESGVYSANIVLAVNSGSLVRAFSSPTGSHTLQPDAMSLWINDALIINNATGGLTPAALIRDVSFATGSGSWANFSAGSVFNGYYEIDDIVVKTVSNFTESAFEAWAQSFSLVGDAALSETDLLGDGMTNFLRYTLGGTPTTSSATLQPASGTTVVAEQTHLTFTFDRIADPALTYEVWASHDLADWGDAPIWSSAGTQNTEGEVTVTDPVPMTQNPRRFLHLRVQRP